MSFRLRLPVQLPLFPYQDIWLQLLFDNLLILEKDYYMVDWCNEHPFDKWLDQV